PNTSEDLQFSSLSIQSEWLSDPARYPAIQVAKARVDQGKAKLALEQESTQPDWSFGIQYSQRGNSFSDTLSLAASRPLLLREDERQQRNIEAAQAELEAFQAEQVELERAMVNQARQTWRDWQDGVKRIAQLESDLLPLADQRAQASLDAYKGNTGSLQQAIMARKLEIDLRVELINMKAETAQWWAELEYLLLEEDAS
ncbi:MAG: TolC family protein, partial [Limnobacter sp.]|nr:TolC family protein [Limnobacter sp.]